MSNCSRHIKKLFCLLIVAVLSTTVAVAQTRLRSYTIRDGRMLIELSKDIREASLDSFITQYDLADIGLKQFVFKGLTDSLQKMGWHLEANDNKRMVISKSLEVLEDMKHPGDKFYFPDKKHEAMFFPSLNNNVVMGYNRFRNKAAFQVKDSMVTFFLRNYQKASNVLLAGSFTGWKTKAIPMIKTDSGWIAQVKLGDGKHWYKFIADDKWLTDNDNLNKENDEHGNINSVFYKNNITIRLTGYDQAKKVFIAGSFNGWKPDELRMIKTDEGWQLPLYLREGTHTYRFIVDGKWMADATNPLRLPNEFGEYNSVIQIGKPHLFHLKGNTGATSVSVAGTFNDWRPNELLMTKTDSGWTLPYTIGPGNYQYKFIVDGKWVADPANNVQVHDGNSFLIISPNYTFRLKGFDEAKSVFIAGDFNDWSPNSLSMKKEGNEWIFTLHLLPGKHRYKFIVDGKWMLDPANRLWEQNEHHTGNSVLWIEEPGTATSRVP